jgi:hypothetical protein
LQCGFVNGQFQCGVDIGKGDPLKLPGSLPKSGGAPAAPSGKQASCPDRYASAFDQCCPSDTRVSDDGRFCQPLKPDQVPKPEFQLPPPVPQDLGDFPIVKPGPDEEYG